MHLSFDASLAASYANPAKRVRVLTEDWVKRQLYCPNCGHGSIEQHPNNSRAADFFCVECKEEYELKSQKDRFSLRVNDGAYGSVMQRLNEGRNPNLFLLNYALPTLEVLNLAVVPKQFFTPAIIEKRKPLAPSARRAGWVGCNFLLQQIPEVGRSLVVRGRVIESKDAVLKKWQETLFLREQAAAERAWLLAIMKCVEKLDPAGFSLTQVYSFEADLRQTYPRNQHIKEKIRQQLQVLRDKGYLQFLGKGLYRRSVRWAI
jgi:type II restriction enzyme